MNLCNVNSMQKCRLENGQFKACHSAKEYSSIPQGRKAEGFGAKRDEQIDYDEEARKIFKQLGLPDPRENTQKEKSDEWANWYGMPSVVYVHPRTGAKFYIGDESAAGNLDCLVKNKIFHIVNAQGDRGRCYHEKDKRFQYLRFAISNSQNYPDIETPEGVLKFFAPTHCFIEENLEAGNNVMVHCMAGAHRAGTTGVSYLMRAGRMGYL